MKLMKNWCVGYTSKEGVLKLHFRAEGVLNDDSYTIDYSIPVVKGGYRIDGKSETIKMKKMSLGNIVFKMIAQTSGINIVKRLDTDEEFKKMLSEVIIADLICNDVHINFELSKEAYEALGRIETISFLVNKSEHVIVIESSEDSNYIYLNHFNFFPDKVHLSKEWLYLFEENDENELSLSEEVLIKEGSTIYTLEYWVEEVTNPDPFDTRYRCFVVDIKKIKVNY